MNYRKDLNDCTDMSKETVDMSKETVKTKVRQL